MPLFDAPTCRNVVAVGAAPVTAACLLQVTDVPLPSPVSPAWVPRVAFFLQLVAVFVASAYPLTPAGVRREKDGYRSERIAAEFRGITGVPRSREQGDVAAG